MSGESGQLTREFIVREYDLAETLTSGQAFRWKLHANTWRGVIGRRWVGLTQRGDLISAEITEPTLDWDWLTAYLQLRVELETVVKTFPDDEPMQRAVAACRGLRLLRQDPWECLASFILSSTKQIVQIQQIVRVVCERFGEPLKVPTGVEPAWTFPSAKRLAQLEETDLRACKMGFRAPNLLAAAQRVATGELDLERLHRANLAEARQQLLSLPGVGNKIANCVLLFAYGFQGAFPVDVWVRKAIQQLYFPKRKVKPERIERFVETHFGPYSGYAQQYLFHYMRRKARSAIGVR